MSLISLKRVPRAGVEIRVPVGSANDVVAARHAGRQLAQASGFSAIEATRLTSVISELARNILSYARRGEIVLRQTGGTRRRGIAVVARDHGPGIANSQVASLAGYSTSGGLGLGLPGVRRIADEFRIESQPGAGTTVIVHKWRP